MKKLYEMPAIELTKFDVEDVITASSALVDVDTFKTNTGANAVTEWDSSWNTTMGI